MNTCTMPTMSPMPAQSKPDTTGAYHLLIEAGVEHTSADDTLLGEHGTRMNVVVEQLRAGIHVRGCTIPLGESRTKALDDIAFLLIKDLIGDR